jgi:hypothetical protein
MEGGETGTYLWMFLDATRHVAHTSLVGLCVHNLQHIQSVIQIGCREALDDTIEVFSWACSVSTDSVMSR